MATDRHLQRRRKLIRALRGHGVDAMLLTNEKNVKYLTGFTGDSTFLLLSPRFAILISDSRYETQLADECPGLDAHIRSNREPMTAATATVIARAHASHVGFESSSLTYEMYELLAGALKSAELKPCGSAVEELRAVKDAGEVEEIRRAIEQAERGFHLIRAAVTREMTERQIAHDLEHAMRRFGAAGVSFEPIVAAGPHAALPHARPRDRTISDAPFVLVDWGATTRAGYRSDLTRLWVTGKISPKLEKVYGVVLNAQQRAIGAIRPGVRCCDIDDAARTVIAKAGYGKNFGHSLGHGIGLDIHELPRVSPIHESVLAPGMIVTVEPGIYLPGWGGVRVEDDVLVTADGCEVLTSVSRELEAAVLPP